MNITPGHELRHMYPDWPRHDPRVVERVDTTVEDGARGWVIVWHYGTEGVGA